MIRKYIKVILLSLTRDLMTQSSFFATYLLMLDSSYIENNV